MADKKIKEPTYKDLSKIYTDEEIVESFVLRSEMTEEEQKIAHEEFLKFHFEHIKNMSESEIILGNLMRMKIQIEDYINNDVYDEKFSFGNQLKEYISIIKRSQKEFAEEIDVHTTKLNRIVNDRDNPNIDLFFRIEKHSDGILSARNLHRLHSMKLESDMVKNVEKKRIQYGKVKNKLSFGKTG